MKGGIFFRKMPLGSVLSGYSNSGAAVAVPVLNQFELATASNRSLSKSRMPAEALLPMLAYPRRVLPGLSSSIPVLKARTRLSPRTATHSVDSSPASAMGNGEQPASRVATIAEGLGEAAALADAVLADEQKKICL